MDKPLSILRSLTGLIPKGFSPSTALLKLCPHRETTETSGQKQPLQSLHHMQKQNVAVGHVEKMIFRAAILLLQFLVQGVYKKIKRILQETYPLSRTIPFEKLPDGRFIATRMAKKLHSCSFHCDNGDTYIYISRYGVYIYSVKHSTWYMVKKTYVVHRSL